MEDFCKLLLNFEAMLIIEKIQIYQINQLLALKPGAVGAVASHLSCLCEDSSQKYDLVLLFRDLFIT